MLVTLSGLGQAEDRGPGLDEALAQAKERGVPVVVDFFTDWCVYCKHFNADLARPATGLREALDATVFTSIDAEKGEGPELAKLYGVSGFPTYVVLNADGELLDRWSGYGGPEHFLGALGPALADPTTVAQKKARFEASPTAEDAEKLARFASADGEYSRAIDLFRRATELDSSRDLSEDLVYTAYLRARKDAGFSAADFVDFVTEELDDEAAGEGWMLAVNLASRLAQREESIELMRPVLEGALSAAKAQSGPDAESGFDEVDRRELKILSLLHLEGRGDEAAQLKKESMKEGWLEDANGLNAYAWWCFENGVNLVEAEALARRGIELAEPGTEKAMVLDTAAEICNARGNCRDSVTLIQQAIAEDPEDESYPRQLERFQKILASSE